MKNPCKSAFLLSVAVVLAGVAMPSSVHAGGSSEALSDRIAAAPSGLPGAVVATAAYPGAGEGKPPPTAFPDGIPDTMAFSSTGALEGLYLLILDCLGDGIPDSSDYSDGIPDTCAFSTTGALEGLSAFSATGALESHY